MMSILIKDTLYISFFFILQGSHFINNDTHLEEVVQDTTQSS
jgi:hypothetical protein